MRVPDTQLITDRVEAFFKNLSAKTLEWFAIIIFHSATIPSILALMAGITDATPAVDLVLLLWTGLVLLFVKAAAQRDMLNIITIGLGFVVQSMMIALIFFK